MKYTLCITQECNLSCTYCYIGKKHASMSPDTACAVVDFMFEGASGDEIIDIGFFGGEPLLRFGLIKSITSMIKSHRLYDPDRLFLSVITNGTVFSDEIAEYLTAQGIEIGISCDGPPSVQDRFRRFPDGSASSAVVEETIKQVVGTFPGVLVNAVYTPATLACLPETVEYLVSLGLKRIHLNADYSAAWTKEHIDVLRDAYAAVAQRYSDYYRMGKPVYIDIIDNKITVMLRGGYQPAERCSMGKGEFAFAPSGNIYPCERLVGADDSSVHCIGNVADGVDPGRMACRVNVDSDVNAECTECGIRDYCRNWCGCSNYFSSGYYNRVGPFLCAAEQAAVKVAFGVFEELEKELGGVFVEHLSGRPYANAVVRNQGGR